MAKVFGVHEIELNPGVQGEDFERFVAREYLPSVSLPGVTGSLLRGDRGERVGRILPVWEFESRERRDGLFLNPDVRSSEMQQWLQTNAPLIDQWKTMTPWPSVRDTDNIEVGEQPNRRRQPTSVGSPSAARALS